MMHDFMVEVHACLVFRVEPDTEDEARGQEDRNLTGFNLGVVVQAASYARQFRTFYFVLKHMHINESSLGFASGF